MKITCGIKNNTIDVTNICIEELTKNNIITIPQGDCNRTRYFTDRFMEFINSYLLKTIVL